jgi:hypothetical protein
MSKETALKNDSKRGKPSVGALGPGSDGVPLDGKRWSCASSVASRSRNCRGSWASRCIGGAMA